jgi:hypothetical protein
MKSNTLPTPGEVREQLNKMTEKLEFLRGSL